MKTEKSIIPIFEAVERRSHFNRDAYVTKVQKKDWSSGYIETCIKNPMLFLFRIINRRMR